ncbi:MAG: hypothetical protein UT37_C0007G0021 [Parcubacteria group bacterium GW2011_GWA2_39_18]|nr:MAG: hypothetical protein UT37_C0007G0021 [Parcubacteria group bacterium GW2011_GWA2_39_18]
MPTCPRKIILNLFDRGVGFTKEDIRADFIKIQKEALSNLDLLVSECLCWGLQFGLLDCDGETYFNMRNQSPNQQKEA